MFCTLSNVRVEIVVEWFVNKKLSPTNDQIISVPKCPKFNQENCNKKLKLFVNKTNDRQRQTETDGDKQRQTDTDRDRQINRETG